MYESLDFRLFTDRRLFYINIAMTLVMYIIRHFYSTSYDHFNVWYALLIVFCMYAFIEIDRMFATLWAIIFTSMMVQNIVFSMDMYKLPAWFMIYPTVPLLGCSVIENLILYITNDDWYKSKLPHLRKKHDTPQQQTDPEDVDSIIRDISANFSIIDNKYTLSLIDTMLDEEIMKYYPNVFETYMYVCSILLCIYGGGIASANCILDLYMIIITFLLVLSENMKRKTYVTSNAKPVRLPTSISKATYMLYAPPLFWPNLLTLIIFNVALSNVSHRRKVIVIILIIVLTVYVFMNRTSLMICPFR